MKGVVMEEIITQIDKYHQLSILCFTGMILCGLLTGLIYRKKNIRGVLGYYRRKQKYKKIWMFAILCILCCGTKVVSYATERNSIEEEVAEPPEEQPEDPEVPEEPENLPPILEKFHIGTDEELLEYVKDSTLISVCIRDEQISFNPFNVILEYHIEGEEWHPINSQQQIWNNLDDSVFETTYEVGGVEGAENVCEFRLSYIDDAEIAMTLGENVQAEEVEGCEGTYLAKKKVVFDYMPPSYEAVYKDEMGKLISFSEDGLEIVPYYNAAKEVVMDFEVKESYLDLKNTKMKITATDFKGNVIAEEVPKLIEGKFQTSIKADGHYLLKVHLADLAGNKTIHEKKFALDHTPPKQPVITYKTEKGTLLEKILHQLTFGYFSKEKIIASIDVEDEISGLKQVTYSYKNIDSEEIFEKTLETMELPVKLELPYSFKGQVSVQCEDSVGNVSETFTDIGVIAESEQTHKKESNASVEVLTKPSKTSNYYASDVNLKYSVRDSYSGVKEVQYLAGSFGEETVSYSEETEIVTNLITKEYTLSAKDNQKNEIAVGLNFTDNAGYVTTVAKDALPKIHIDTIAPQIRIVYDHYDAENEKYYKKDRVATVFVTEKNFDPEDVRFHISGPNAEIGAWHHEAAADCQANNQPYHTGHSVNCVWKCNVKFETDGEYQFGFSCVDLAGNQGDYGTVDEFVIDKTAPTIYVDYNNYDVKNEIFYGAPRIARITIREKNFYSENVVIKMSAENEGISVTVPNVSNWISSGDNHQAVIAYNFDARFTFDIAFADLAGNEAEDYPEDYFCVDMTNPEIKITEIADKSANNGIVSPLITVTDTNYEKENTWYELIGWENGLIEVEKANVLFQNGEVIRIKDFEHVQEADDLYRLTIGAADLAGNTAEKRISFSVNRFGSVYTLEEETERLAGKGGAYYTNEEKQLVITETNVDALEFIEIICSLNGKLRTLVEGKDYIVHKSGEEVGWKQYRYELQKNNFMEDGHYTITIYSEDRAKNVSDNQSKGKSLSFAVDKSYPSIVVSGIKQNGRYRENSREILLNVQDNLSMVQMTVILDGKTTVYDMETLNALKGKVSLTAKAKNSWQTLDVYAEDQAGNQTEIKEITFLITPNLWIQFYNNKPLFYGSMITAALITVSAAGCLVYSKRKRNSSS